MTAASTYLAVFAGSRSSPRWRAWEGLSAAERQAKEQAGLAAWSAWTERHRNAILVPGGPLGKAQHIDGEGRRDLSNTLCAFVVVRADSPQAAAQMFAQHPHFTIFPGDAIEVMPILAVPPA